MDQYNRAVRRFSLLYTMLIEKKCCLIFDDETYVKADFKSLPGNQYYSSRDISNLDESEKVIPVEKLPCLASYMPVRHEELTIYHYWDN